MYQQNPSTMQPKNSAGTSTISLQCHERGYCVGVQGCWNCPACHKLCVGCHPGTGAVLLLLVMGVVLTRQLNRGIFLRGGRMGMGLASSLQGAVGEQTIKRARINYIMVEAMFKRDGFDER